MSDALGRAQVDGPVGDDRLGAVAARGHAGLRAIGPACADDASLRGGVGRGQAQLVAASNASSRKRRRRLRVVEQRQRAAGAGPGDVREPPLLLERALRLRRVARSSGGPGTRPRARCTWSHSRPLVPCAVARVSAASSRRSSASRCAARRRWRPAAPSRSGSGAAQPSIAAARSAGVGPSASRASPASVAARGGLLAQRPPRAGRARAAATRRRRAAVGDRPIEQAVDPLVLDRQRQVRAPGTGRRGRARRRRRPAARGSSARGSARVDASSGQVRIARVTRTRSSAASGARTSRPVALGPGEDPLREPLAVVLDEPDRALDDRPRAPVVRLEVDPPQARQRRPRGRGPVARRRAASRRSTGRRRPRGTRRSPGAASSSASSSWVRSRSCASSTSSRAQRAAPARPARARRPGGARARGRRGRRSRRRRAPRSPARRRRTRCATGPGAGSRGDVVGRDAEVQLEPREREVQPAAVRRGGLREQLAQERVAVDERLDRDAGLGEHLASEGVEGPDPDRARRQAERRQRGVEPLGQLLGRPPVERDDADRPGVRSAVDEPGHPRDQGRRLAGPRRRNAQHRPGRRGRGGALVRGEPAEPLGDRRIHGSLGHEDSVIAARLPATQPNRRASVQTRPSRPVDGGLSSGPYRCAGSGARVQTGPRPPPLKPRVPCRHGGTS